MNWHSLLTGIAQFNSVDGVRAEGEPQLAAGAHCVVDGRERVDDRGAFGP